MFKCCCHCQSQLEQTLFQCNTVYGVCLWCWSAQLQLSVQIPIDGINESLTVHTVLYSKTWTRPSGSNRHLDSKEAHVD